MMPLLLASNYTPDGPPAQAVLLRLGIDIRRSRNLLVIVPNGFVEVFFVANANRWDARTKFPISQYYSVLFIFYFLSLYTFW
jgi:hypothetical protein